MGDRELLAIKLALVEWRHWLKGTEQPSLIWMDHKNTEYIRTAKRLNLISHYPADQAPRILNLML